ncbi:MAG TPA: hypothetical protein VE404_06455 [Verrucomicrobiae bacterium]|nr:hypothetical protein [Verrucomicrobiae bacterium]
MVHQTTSRLIVAAFVVLLGAASAQGGSTGGNGQYQVAVENAPAGVGLGVYTFGTGTMHPVAGALGAQSILVGGGFPGTSYTTIRSYTSGTDYAQRNWLTLGGGAPPTLALEPFVAAGEEAIPVGNLLNPAGFTTIYRLGDFAPAPDNLVIRQTAAAVGTTFNDSAVMLKTEITNAGNSPVSIGVRYLWDLQIGPNDDGPTFRPRGPDGPPAATDMTFFDPNFSSFELTDDNDPDMCFGIGNAPFPFFAVQGSVQGPPSLKPTPPSRLSYVSWPDSSGLPGKFGGVVPALSAFDVPSLGMDVSTCLTSIDDTGVAEWWGDTAGNALTVAPGATVAVTAYVYAFLPGAPPSFPPPPPPPGAEGPAGDPTCSDGLDNDHDGLIDMNDPGCVPPPPPPPAVEGPPGDPTCSDGVDNDQDGHVDLMDPDCVSQSTTQEGPPGDPTCSDGLDNDGDGLIDANDPDCVASNHAPVCETATASEMILWPPNHKLHTVKIQGVTDADGDPISITVTSIRQDEPLGAAGNGNTCPDAFTGAEAAGHAPSLRVERSGEGDGRVYHIRFNALDGEGGGCTGEVTVCVPHDRGRDGGGRGCVDQGPRYDSTGPCEGKPKRGHDGRH